MKVLYQVIAFPNGLDLDFVFCSNVLGFILMKFDRYVLELFLNLGTNHCQKKRVMIFFNNSYMKVSRPLVKRKYSDLQRVKRRLSFEIEKVRSREGNLK